MISRGLRGSFGFENRIDVVLIVADGGMGCRCILICRGINIACGRFGRRDKSLEGRMGRRWYIIVLGTLIWGQVNIPRSLPPRGITTCTAPPIHKALRNQMALSGTISAGFVISNVWSLGRIAFPEEDESGGPLRFWACLSASA